MIGLLVSATQPSPAKPQFSTQDETAIRQILSGMEDAWDRGDAKAWAQYFSRDAELITVTGEVVQGRDGIEERFASLFADVLSGSRLTQKIRVLRLLRPDVAVADTDMELYGYKALPPSMTPPAGVAVAARSKSVMLYVDGKWWIVSSQSTYVPPPH